MILLGPPHGFSHTKLSSSGDHVPAYYEERMKEGKVIKVQDVAFITYVCSRPVAVADRPISPVSKRFYSTCTRAISNSLPLGPKQTAKPGPLKSFLLSRTTYLDPRLNPSTALLIRYFLWCPIPRIF